MRLQISLSPQLATKLRQLSIQELRPIGLQAEYLLIQAINEARCTPESPQEHPQQEVDHATA